MNRKTIINRCNNTLYFILKNKSRLFKATPRSLEPEKEEYYFKVANYKGLFNFYRSILFGCVIMHNPNYNYGSDRFLFNDLIHDFDWV